jgi:hypothetical protein
MRRKENTRDLRTVVLELLRGFKDDLSVKSQLSISFINYVVHYSSRGTNITSKKM